jgi:hypothetical protein
MAGGRDGNLDAAVVVVAAQAVGAEGRRARQCGRLEQEDSRPGALSPRRRAGVVDVHTRVDAHPDPASDQPVDVGVSASGRTHLTT